MAEKIKDLNIVICGVGGQGTLLASRILGHMALSLGHDVKVSEVHGMSQRGGSVITYVRMGEKVYSPMIEQKGADYVLAFEELEAREAAGLVRTALSTLEREDRELFVRRYYYGQTVARAAEEMGMNLSTAKSRLRRGWERLKEALRKAGYDVEEA